MPNIGDLAVGGIRPVVSPALQAALQLAIGSGVVYNLVVLNYAAAASQVLLLDQTASPAGYSGTAVTPIWAFPIAASTAAGPGTLGGGAFLTPPIAFRNGLWVMLSTVITSPFTATAAGATAGYFSALVQQG